MLELYIDSDSRHRLYTGIQWKPVMLDYPSVGGSLLSLMPTVIGQEPAMVADVAYGPCTFYLILAEWVHATLSCILCVNGFEYKVWCTSGIFHCFITVSLIISI